MSWLETTKEGIQKLFNAGYFNNWRKLEKSQITFYLHPEVDINDDWLNKRLSIYLSNAAKLHVTAPAVDFYVYTSLEFGKTLGIVPATSFISSKQIHGHPNQSPGHELTHILLGELNSPENLPANGLWAEGVCVFLDGTGTDRRKHTPSLNYAENAINTPWEKWRRNLPSGLYPLAGSITQYLDNLVGWEKILTFLKELKNFGTNDAELSELLFDKKYPQLQDGWRNWLKLKPANGRQDL